MSANQFLIDSKEAINSLVDQIAGKAMVELPCLRIGTREEVSSRLRALIVKTVDQKFAGGDGCTGAFDGDGVFVVAVEEGVEPGATRIGASLFLGETWIR